MQIRHFVKRIIYTLSLILILLPLASCSTPDLTTTPVISPSADHETTIGNVIVQAHAGENTSEVKEPVVTQETSISDGRPILENICAQCHVVQSLILINKSRVEWEGVLRQMEMMGVQLSENEKVILLDYLATAEKR